MFRVTAKKRTNERTRKETCSFTHIYTWCETTAFFRKCCIANYSKLKMSLRFFLEYFIAFVTLLLSIFVVLFCLSNINTKYYFCLKFSWDYYSFQLRNGSDNFRLSIWNKKNGISIATNSMWNKILTKK